MATVSCGGQVDQDRSGAWRRCFWPRFPATGCYAALELRRVPWRRALIGGCLAAVYLFPPINGAQRWIRFGPLGLQPSEFAKLAFVLGLARYLMHRRSYRELPGLLAPLAIVVVPLVLVLKEPDLGTALVFLPVLLMMLFAAEPAETAVILVMLAGAAQRCPAALVANESRAAAPGSLLWLRQTHPGEKPSDDAYHLHQAKQVAGFFGRMAAAIRRAGGRHG